MKPEDTYEVPADSDNETADDDAAQSPTDEKSGNCVT